MVDLLYLAGLAAVLVAFFVIGDVVARRVARWLGFEDEGVEW